MYVFQVRRCSRRLVREDLDSLTTRSARLAGKASPLLLPPSFLQGKHFKPHPIERDDGPLSLLPTLERGDRAFRRGFESDDRRSDCLWDIFGKNMWEAACEFVGVDCRRGGTSVPPAGSKPPGAPLPGDSAPGVGSAALI